MAGVIVIEDDLALLEAMAEILTLSGHETRKAASAEEALERLEEEAPDMIVADVLLPGMSGIDLADRVREHPDWKDIPILFVSASTLLQHENRIAAMERSAFLRKPFDVKTLQDAVMEMLAVG